MLIFPQTPKLKDGSLYTRRAGTAAAKLVDAPPLDSLSPSEQALVDWAIETLRKTRREAVPAAQTSPSVSIDDSPPSREPVTSAGNWSLNAGLTVMADSRATSSYSSPTNLVVLDERLT